MLQLMREGCSYTYPPLSIARYSFIQLSKLEQCRVNNLPQGFNTAAQDSNPGSRSRESEALPLSHCGLHHVHNQVHLWFNFVKLSSSSLFLFLWPSVISQDVCFWDMMFTWYDQHYLILEDVVGLLMYLVHKIVTMWYQLHLKCLDMTS